MIASLKFRVLNKAVLIPAAVGVVSFGAGYLLGRRNKTVELRPTDTHEVPPIKVNRNTTIIPAKVVPPKVVIDEQDFIERKIKEKEVVVEKIELVKRDPLPIELVTRSVFDTKIDDPNWVIEDELVNRTPHEPYIISRDEFFAEENEYNQLSYTYYAGDDVLADQEEKPIYNANEVAGKLKFGHGSGDLDVVYIRNDKRREEYEIIRDPGLYSVEVQGLEAEQQEEALEVRHSNNRRFRANE